LETVGVWFYIDVLRFEKSDDIVVSLEFFVAKFWVAVDLEVY
jgi:hypothetical protein